MNFKSPKFKSKIKRVLLLTAGWMFAAIYIIIVQAAPFTIEFHKSFLERQFLENSVVTILEVFFTGLILAFFEVFYFTDRFKNKSFRFCCDCEKSYFM